MADLDTFQVFNSINEEPKENNFASVNDITGSNQELVNLPNNFDQNQVSNSKSENEAKEGNDVGCIETNGADLDVKGDAIKSFNNQQQNLEENHLLTEASVPLKVGSPEKSDGFKQFSGVESTLPSFAATQNSINLIQQGNSFMPMQKLTPEQMAQVIAVVQQKKIEQQQNLETSVNNLDSQGHRLAYKIIIPGENNNNMLNNETYNSNQMYSMLHNNNNTGLPQDTYQMPHKKVSTGATDVRMRMEKEHKKKHRPRTRSGRISKPPNFVVKDYVRLHQLDYEEDYDDSDGGYSDYKMSSGEEEEEKNKFSFKETSVLSSC